MLKNLISCVDEVSNFIKSSNTVYMSVEECIAAPFFTIISTDGKFIVKNSNGCEVTDDTILLNDMYKTIMDFSNRFVKANIDSYKSFKAGFFYFPTDKPRHINYPKYSGKFMMSYIDDGSEGDVNIGPALSSMGDEMLPFMPLLNFQKITKTTIQYIKDCANRDITPFELATILSCAHTNINVLKGRTRIQDMEGVVVRFSTDGKKSKQYIIRLNECNPINDSSERKMCRDILLKDFCRWFVDERPNIINDTYTNIISDLFVKYINYTDFANKYDIDAKFLEPPHIGYIGDLTYDLIDDKTVVAICKHSEIFKNVFKILFNTFRKPIKSHEGGILSETNVKDLNDIIKAIKTEVI